MKTNNLNYVKSLLLILISIFIISCSNDSGAIDTDPPIIDNPPDDTQAFNETEDGTPIQNPRVRIVLLKTSDVEITQDKIDRLRDVGKYIEMYYSDQLTEKGYTLTNTKMLARNTDDDILIYTVESPLASANLNNITSTGVNLAKTKYPDLNDLNTVWAVAHFKDGGGSSGGGKITGGKMKFSYKTASGSIDFSSHPAGTPFHKEIILKAILHELGHALTMPHNGPLQDDVLANTMMGPVNNAYENTVGVETADVIISDFSASLLANHPVFKNSPFNTNQLDGKTLRIEKIQGDANLFTSDCATTGKSQLRGKVISNLPFHHVVVRFLYDGSSDYWGKAFAVVPDTDGIFELPIEKSDINILNENQYELMVSFDNGLTRGVGELETTVSITDVQKHEYVDTYAFCN